VTEIAEPLLTLTISSPKHKMMGIEIIVIVGPKFLKTAASHVQQFNFHFRAGLSVFAALYNILLARTRSLHHLVDSSIAVERKETLAKFYSQLIDGIALTVEVEVFPNDSLLQNFSF
jgi:hypothetical protein